MNERTAREFPKKGRKEITYYLTKIQNSHNRSRNSETVPRTSIMLVKSSLIYYPNSRILGPVPNNSSRANNDCSTSVPCDQTRLNKQNGRRRDSKMMARSLIHFRTDSSRLLSSSRSSSSADDTDDCSVSSCDKTVQVSNVNDSIELDAHWILSAVFQTFCNAEVR